MAVSRVLPHVFSPVKVGTLDLSQRVVVPTHAGGGGSLTGPGPLFERFLAYWKTRIDGGAEWIGGSPAFVASPANPGFEATGVGANQAGTIRTVNFASRLATFTDMVHSSGAYVTQQFLIQGGTPLGPSNALSGFFEHRIPHATSLEEINWLVGEYAASAKIVADAGVDALELHACHDDLLQWFLSPFTNKRTDAYGGSLENNRRLVREIVERMRDSVGRPITLGLRLNLEETVEGGQDVEYVQELVSAFTADGTVDYFSFVAGDNWGRLPYIQPGFFKEGEWAPTCGRIKEATNLPVIYVGRVASVERAEEILAAGQADLVGMARAAIADPMFLRNAREGSSRETRHCIGMNECIDRGMAEGMSFGCGINPRAGRAEYPDSAPAKEVKDVLVIGGGPAGTEFAAQMAERGHHVRLWEGESALGGQFAAAGRLRIHGDHYPDWIQWQGARLKSLDVDVVLNKFATAADVLAAEADIVAVATGATPRRPLATGLDQPNVVTAYDVARGVAVPSGRVVLLSEDDRSLPLTVADHIASLGLDVTVVHASPGPSSLVSKYTIGAILARLDAQGVKTIPSARLTAVNGRSITLSHIYSGRTWDLTDVDTVVLACGSVPEDGLFHELSGVHPEVHLLGDAYAPRRAAFATLQALELAELLSPAE
ncbi:MULTISPECIES: oxidoreductase [unclassified Rhodococcus (in: high G+C Gram-positive bacteria)]|uniref:oxidoreductase n=1 Tax=unclassified Rhodococcus (in: high G+C Gram-positive bacteria) TaxID=192944 RepID=UPI000926603C|nr:FAD-dependent oxidoreductase [Rhodococcus sp. M8]OLL19227.1 hypothetical protein BKE56_004005 [Rhodococcus sp. M8]QPG47916.1 FAD-dependent oxidoreductase [Rhodococcus sp. M8]